MAGKKIVLFDETDDAESLEAIEAVYTAETDTSKALKPDGSNGVVWGSVSAVFGSEYDESDSWGESNTTSASYVDKISWTTGTLPAGDYLVFWAYQTYRSGGTSVEAQLTEDAVAIHDSSHTQTDYISYSGLRQRTLSNATHTFEIEYKQTGGGTAYIKEAIIVIWRVS
jgi:hypothetical protein